MKVVHCGHHKCGSVWIAYIMDSLARHLGKVFTTIGNDPFLTHYEGDFFYSYTSLVTFDEFDYVSSHLIRDPRDVIVSAYYYHQSCIEGWCLTPLPEFGVTYSEKLKSLPKNEGISFEMNHYSKDIMWILDYWDYSDPKCLELKYEDLIADTDKVLEQLFLHWRIPVEQIPECLEIARQYHMTRLTGRKIGEIQLGSHMRSGKPGQWKTEFTDEHKREFKELFGELVIKLGYEKDNNW